MASAVAEDRTEGLGSCPSVALDNGSVDDDEEDDRGPMARRMSSVKAAGDDADCEDDVLTVETDK